MRKLKQDIQHVLQETAKGESLSFSFEEIWARHSEDVPSKGVRYRKWIAGVASAVAGLGIAGLLISTIVLPNNHNQRVSLGNAAPNEGLRNDIFAERGFTVSKQQNVTAEFTLQPSWIPAQDGAKNDISQVFYNGHNTQISVDYVWRKNDGNVEVVIGMVSRFSTDGGSFVTPTVITKQSDGSTALTSINWGQTVTAGQTGTVNPKRIPPLFSNAQTHQPFTIHDVSSSVGDSELMFEISPAEVKKYFSQPVTVTIPDLNLITYKPLASVIHNRSLYNPKLGWLDLPSRTTDEYYVVTNQACTPGEPLGAIRDEGGGLGGSPPTASVLPSGTQIYSIKGVDSQEAVCVALDYGNKGYVKAVYAGQTVPK